MGNEKEWRLSEHGGGGVEAEKPGGAARLRHREVSSLAETEAAAELKALAEEIDAHDARYYLVKLLCFVLSCPVVQVA